MSDAERLGGGRIVSETRDAVDAATVLLLRDGPDGLQVLMLERHVETDFAGGALVFPGGRVDPADAALPPHRWDGIEPQELADVLGTDPRGAVGLLVAGVRECFEEAGVLLARHADGREVDGELLGRPEVVAARAALAARDDDGDLAALLEEHDLVLELGALLPWSWWVTPRGVHRRYDTRFLVARVPAAQQDRATPDRVETTSARWTTPDDALADGRAGVVTVIYPTRQNLAELRRFSTAEQALAAARAGEVDLRRIVPEIVRVDGRPLVAHPDGGEPEPA